MKNPKPKDDEITPSKRPATVDAEILNSLGYLNDNIKKLDETLNLIREHEFVEFHSSKWKIFAHQILLGILFAIGTVLGLVLLSWMTYTFFKDSVILRDIVDNQLKLRRFDLNQIKEKAQDDVTKSKTTTIVATGSTTSTQDTASGNTQWTK